MKTGKKIKKMTTPSSEITTAKLFKNGQSQAVRLPKEFRFQGDHVYIKKVGDAVMLLPRRGYWQLMVESLDMFSPDFCPERPPQKRSLREEVFD